MQRKSKFIFLLLLLAGCSPKPEHQNTPYNDQLTDYVNPFVGTGGHALIDGIPGAEDFHTGTWLGYFDEDLIAILDLGRQRTLNEISINFLQDHWNWIFLPVEVECLVSADGKNYRPIGKKELDSATEVEEAAITKVSFTAAEQDIRYLRLIAKKPGKLPEWHIGFPDDGRTWIFADEISIN